MWRPLTRPLGDSVARNHGRPGQHRGRTGNRFVPYEGATATGVYWIAPFEVLERAGFAVYLVDAQATKQVGGRKSGVLDCQWIRELKKPFCSWIIMQRRMEMSDRETPVSIPAPHETEKTMKQSRFPKGWDEKRVSELLAHYETQTEDEIVAEDEATLLDPEQTVMEVPAKLVPMVRELIARHKDVGDVP